MNDLIRNKDDALVCALEFESDRDQFESNCHNLERDIKQTEKDIASLEEDLDDTLTEAKNAIDRVSEQQKTAGDAELQASALTRRIQLVDEELNRVTTRLLETQKKTSNCEFDNG